MGHASQTHDFGRNYYSWALHLLIFAKQNAAIVCVQCRIYTVFVLLTQRRHHKTEKAEAILCTTL